MTDPETLEERIDRLHDTADEINRNLAEENVKRDDRIRWSQRAVVGVSIVALAAIAVAIIAVTVAARVHNVQDTACRDRTHQWTALHGVIIEQNKIEPANPVVLKAFPEFKPFFTPGTPEYRVALDAANAKRDRALAKLGPMPNC